MIDFSVNDSIFIKGTYLLLLRMNNPHQIEIGKLGCFNFPAGNYIYLGSAFGPGGIYARINRHRKLQKPLHWHIDYLRSKCVITAVIIWNQEHGLAGTSIPILRFECLWSKTLLSIPRALIPVSGFGSSDCQSGCPSHLLYFRKISLDEIKQNLVKISPGIIEMGL